MQLFLLMLVRVPEVSSKVSFRNVGTPIDSALKVPKGFSAVIIAKVPGARGLVALPNGDLIVGTADTEVAIISNADGADSAGPVTVFATFPKQAPSSSPWPTNSGPQSVAFGSGYIFASTEKTIWRMVYKDGQKTGTPVNISSVRTGDIAPNSDGDVHLSTSVAVNGPTLYAAVGSSCDACKETDPTRATIQMMALDGTGMTLRARRWRNAIAFAIDPRTKAV